MHIEKVDRTVGSLLILNSMINDGVAIPLGAKCSVQDEGSVDTQ